MPDIVITSPKYSFVKFGDFETLNSCCQDGNNFCIPVIEENDTWFQVQLACLNSTVVQQIFDTAPENFQLLLLSGTGNTSGTYAANTIRNWQTDGLLFTKFQTSPTEVTMLWKQNFKDIKTLVNCNECFELALVVIVDSISYVAISNCFIRKCDDCFMSVIQYANNEDGFGFNYCNTVNPINRVRLPLYFNKPQFPDEESIYTKSDGSIKILKSVTKKEFQALIDYAPEHIHEKLKVALSHDTISITNEGYSGNFRKSGSYEIEWDDLFLCSAQAKFKALATPYAVKNNNCEECTDLEGVYLCPVRIGELDHETVMTGEKVSWVQTHGATFPYKYLVYTPAVSAGAPVDVPGNTPDLIYHTDGITYPNLSPGEHTITVVPVCQIDGEFYSGEPQSITITI